MKRYLMDVLAGVVVIATVIVAAITMVSLLITLLMLFTGDVRPIVAIPSVCGLIVLLSCIGTFISRFYRD